MLDAVNILNTMTPEYLELVARLQELILFLERYNEKSWSKYFIGIKEQLENGNRQGVLTLSQMRGGMGSFSDLVICKINGHEIREEDEAKVNEELIQLAEGVFTQTRQIRACE